MTDKTENERFYKQVNKLLLSIIGHPKYESFSTHLSTLQYSILKRVGNSVSYEDLPNIDVIRMLKKIKKRMINYGG